MPKDFLADYMEEVMAESFDEKKVYAALTAAMEAAVKEVKAKKPFAPSITNTVTINLVANAQLSSGGAAAMVYLPDEGESVAESAPVLYINMGTLFPIYEETLPRTARKLKELGKPWVLDPVGIGIGSLRTKLLLGFKETPPAIIRCNASEAIALAKLWALKTESASSGPSGVESIDEVETSVPSAVALSRFIKGAVAVSGKEDFVTDGHIGVWSKGGSPLMERMTGAGCSLGGVCAVYAAVTKPFIAALAATQLYNAAARRAEGAVNAPGTFQSRFLDELFLATPSDVARNECSVQNVERII